MPGDINDDDYVANLLKKDAKDAKKKYELVGIDAFNPKRAKSGAPKPNKNFLRHIIRQTDSHNAALLAREAEESNARLKDMNRERLRAQKNEETRKSRKADGRLTPVLGDEDDQDTPARRRNDRGEGGSRHRRRDRSVELYSRRRRSRSRESRHGKRKRRGSDDGRSKRAERHHKRRRDDHSSGDEEDTSCRNGNSSRRRRRSSSPLLSPPDERDERAGKKRRPRDPSSSPRYRRREKSRRASPDAASDSDPLETIVGPLPPSIQPNVRSRGRGAHKANSMGLDSRFSSAYDPTIDVRPPSDAEDDWGESVEAFRDRQRWKQQGAERLRAAGFTNAQVKKWAKGDDKDEEDVTWTKQGQAREWDRGKVVDEDGDVELKADWGRLK